MPDGTTRVAYAATDREDQVWVHLDGEVVLVPPARGPRVRGPVAPAGALEAPMPAQVLAVLAEVGSRVDAGTPLVVLEAMKMELPVKAPVAGRVQAVHCAVGDRVAPGRALVDLEPEDGPACCRPAGWPACAASGQPGNPSA